MNSNLNKALVVLVSLALLVGGGLWWRHASTNSTAAKSGPQAPGGQGPAAVTVRAAEVKAGTLRDEVNAVGTLLANESVMIRPEVDGRISEIHFTEGQSVAKGARLVSLDSSEIAAQLQAIEAELTLNRSRLRRAEDLKQKNFISAQALDEARENLNQSLARHAETKARLDKTLIRAPFEGVAGLRQVSPGAYVNKGQDIARLEGIGVLKADFRVPEVFMSKIRQGQEVAVSVDAYPGESFSGQIYAIEPAMDEQTRTVLLRAKVPNPGVRLKPGMFARVSLTLGVRQNALVIPEQALVPRGSDRFVFRVVDGKAVLTKVELGLRRPGVIEVVSGLSPGDVIVTEGQQRLREGAALNLMGGPGDATPPLAQKRGNG